jgi:hypothetical protein
MRCNPGPFQTQRCFSALVPALSRDRFGFRRLEGSRTSGATLRIAREDGRERDTRRTAEKVPDNPGRVPPGRLQRPVGPSIYLSRGARAPKVRLSRSLETRRRPVSSNARQSAYAQFPTPKVGAKLLNAELNSPQFEEKAANLRKSDLTIGNRSIFFCDHGHASRDAL